MASRGVNKVILVGNLGADPETRYTQSGGAVTNFNVATSERWKDKQSGEDREQTEWHRIVMWGRLGEIAGAIPAQGLAGLRRGPHPDAQVAGPGWAGPLHDRDRRQ